MYVSIKVFKIAFVFSLGFARERVERCFPISIVSTGNTTLSWTTGCGSRDLNWLIGHRTQLTWATLNQKLFTREEGAPTCEIHCQLRAVCGNMQHLTTVSLLIGGSLQKQKSQCEEKNQQ
jgi:hypothetical protein